MYFSSHNLNRQILLTIPRTHYPCCKYMMFASRVIWKIMKKKEKGLVFKKLGPYLRGRGDTMITKMVFPG